MLSRQFCTRMTRQPFGCTLARSQFHSCPSRLSNLRTLPLRNTPVFRPYQLVGVLGLGLGLGSAFSKPPILCDDGPAETQPVPQAQAQPQPQIPPVPESSVSFYELSFGTVAGLCAGVFIKKGAKAIAFFLGGVFVLVQYLGTLSIVRVDWGRAGRSFENLFYTTDAAGTKRAPTVSSLWGWLVHFLTADFQPRASFIAGLALGLRIG